MFIALIISALALTLYFPVQRYLVTITDTSYKILVNNLVAGIFPTYSQGDRSGVITALRRVEGQQGVKYVILTDKDNKVYYDSFSGSQSLEGKVLVDNLTSQVTKGDSVRGKVTRYGVSYYNYVAPFISGNQVDYIIRLGIDQQTIDGQFRRLTNLFVSLGLVSVAIGFFAAYVLAARLTSPIIKLTESALAIRAGNLNAYPNISTNDELEQLSREFQRMVEKLKLFYYQEYTQKQEALSAKERLTEINGRLQALDKQKTDFLNAASHQLRTPLSIIHWSLSIIVEEAPHLNLPKDQLELLQESLKSTKRMVDLVNDLLDVSRIEQGRSDLSWAKSNFATVCEQLVAALQPLAQNKNLGLTYKKIGEVADSFLDERRFYQVVNNFVDNAIKYTAQGSVEVTCEQKGTDVEIRVSDTGIGMTDEERKVLFTRFSRGAEAQKMFPNGSGLGMFVAQTILHQHGGEISVESLQGKGTTFILTVPVYLHDPTPVEEGVAAPTEKSPKELPSSTTPAVTDAHA
jgi:signal transduction histidine kinase